MNVQLENEIPSHGTMLLTRGPRPLQLHQRQLRHDGGREMQLVLLHHGALQLQPTDVEPAAAKHLEEEHIIKHLPLK